MKNSGSSFKCSKKLFCIFILVGIFGLWLLTKLRTTSIPVIQHKMEILHTRHIGKEVLSQDWIMLRETENAKQAKGDILLLHGASDSSEIWQKIGTIQNLSSWNWHAVAVDLPGWGESVDVRMPEATQRGSFLAGIISALSLSHPPVIVFASMSGMYVIPYIDENFETVHKSISGLIALAPVQTHYMSKSKYSSLEVPVLHLYGSEDVRLGIAAAKYFKLVPHSKEVVLEGLGHPCYIERPDLWHEHLNRFLHTLTDAKPT